MIVSWPPDRDLVRLEITENRPVLLATTQPGSEAGGPVRLVEVALAEDGHVSPTHAAHENYLTSDRLRYVNHRAGGTTLEVVQRDPQTGLRVTSRLTATASGSVLRQTTTVGNEGNRPLVLAYVSGGTLTGLLHDGQQWRDARVHVCRNGWASEFRWRALSLEDVGLVTNGYPGGGALRSRYSQSGHGSWSSGDALPMGAISRADGATWAWQIENNGPWHWEISSHEPDLVVRLSGPTREEHMWSWHLGPGQEYSSAPTAVAFSHDGLQGALRALTMHRRETRRPDDDNVRLPVIFNDYMNALMGDPCTERELPLIRAAAAAGAEYYVVDCGWYTDDDGWWKAVGDWTESPRRFPGGLREVTDAVRAHGMVPGIWLEPEVVGVRSAAARALPDDAFFRRGGRRVEEAGRFQLDLRHPAAIANLDATVDRLVEDYGVRYLKFDHNINAGPGTGEHPGEAMDGHTRALTSWLDGLLERHPGLVIENCSSGGMRVDDAQLSRLSIQSTSDQQDPLLTAAIAAAAPSALAPEQAAVWAYPQPDMSQNLLTFTLANALTQRIHLSGHLDRMDPAQAAAVAQAVAAYKQIRHLIPRSLPSWPLGLPGWYDETLAMALDCDEATLVTAWNRADGTRTVELPLGLAGPASVRQVFPATAVERNWDPAGRLSVRLPAGPSAVVLELQPQSAEEPRTTTS